MSKDDGCSSASRLYDDGMGDEDDQECELRFAGGLNRLCPQFLTDGSNDNSVVLRELVPRRTEAGTNAPNNDQLEIEAQPAELTAAGNRVLSTSQRLDSDEAAKARDVQTTNAAVTVTTATGTNESGLSDQPLARSGSQMGSLHSPGLPPRPDNAPQGISGSNSANVSVRDGPNSSNQSSGEKRKRASLLVSSYYLLVYVPKKGKETIMIQKRMCQRCKTVVQSKSHSLLVHTANCRFTPLTSKKNALDQSRNQSIPEVSLNSRVGEQRDMLDHAKKEDRGREARDAVLAKRELSEAGLEREAKRQKTNSSLRRSSSRDCEPKDCDRLNLALTRAVVWHNLPFSICDRQKRYDTPFLEMLQEFKQDYPKCCKPNADKLRNTYLPLYYDEVRKRVLRALNLSLSGTYAYGTVMFDGWEDINGSAVVNVMLRVTSSVMASTATYFLDSVYTKDKKVDAEKYVGIIESVLALFQGQRQTPFTGINGAVSDSARACVKAKAMLAANHVGMVTIQDQAHAADLLLSDLGKISWFDEVLSKVNTIVQALRCNRKLLSRFRELIDDYNKDLKKQNASTSETASPRPPAADVWSLLHTWELDELEKQFNDQDSVEEGDNTGEANPPVLRSGEVRRTAVTIKKTVKTRFASAETMLEGYLRSRDVLKLLVRDAEFDRLYDASRTANRDKRNKTFVDVIDNDVFYAQVTDVHKILRVIRRYLRVWDAENAQISEVVPATMIMDYSLNRIGTTPFFTPERKSEVLEALKRRCKGKTTREGSTMQIRILQDVHYTAWLLDPNMCPVNITDYLPAFERHARVYLAGFKTGLDETDCERVAKALTKAYREVHKMWDVLRKGMRNKEILDNFAGQALRYWEDETPAETVLEEPGLATDLQCFARYTLSLCPSSCATERSFSYQGRIHTKQRSRLKPEIVRKLMFCKWNARVLRNVDRLEFNSQKDSEKLKLGAVHPYEEFLNKPTSTSLFGEGESAELLTRILNREHRVQEQIKSARSMLYKHSTVYIYAGIRKEPFAASLRIVDVGLVPGTASSAHTSVQEKSTIVTGELSRMPGTQECENEKRTFHAQTSEQLEELLSASKSNRGGHVRRSGRASQLPFDVDLHAKANPNEAFRNQNAHLGNILRDGDNITMSVATAREMLLNREGTLTYALQHSPTVQREDIGIMEVTTSTGMVGNARQTGSRSQGHALDLDQTESASQIHTGAPHGRSVERGSRGRGRGRSNMSYLPAISSRPDVEPDEGIENDSDDE